MRARWLADARVGARRHAVGRIGCKENRIKKVVGGARHVEDAVLDVAPEVHSHLHVMVAMGDGHHVAIAVNVFLEELRVAVVGAETYRPVIKADRRDAPESGVG